MSKEKQIEEMAKIFCGMKNGCDGCMWAKVHCKERNYAEEIYNAGYRKQEWISVDERLPEKEDDYLVYTTAGFIETDRFSVPEDKDVDGHWFELDDYVTHWMPLPEAPKMKGGEGE